MSQSVFVNIAAACFLIILVAGLIAFCSVLWTRHMDRSPAESFLIGFLIGFLLVFATICVMLLVLLPLATQLGGLPT